MKKSLIVFFFTVLMLHGAPVILPSLEIEANGTVKDMVLHKQTLVLATDNGQVQIYDYEAKTFVKNILLPKVKDFMGDLSAARVFSVDVMDGRYLLLSDSGKGGYANLWMEEEGVLTQLFGADAKQATIKARFITKDKILLGMLSNEAVLFDVIGKKEIFRVQLSPSKFSDFALSLDRSQAVYACESGILNVIDTGTGKELKVLKGQNVDNVYKVDYKQGIVSAAGQDRRAALYDVRSGKGEYIEGSFLIYATGLSAHAKSVAFALDENNDISVFERKSKRKIAVLHGQKSTLNTILFKDENTLFSSSDDSTVMMWNLNKPKG
jgi:WD40 repeat protein